MRKRARCDEGRSARSETTIVTPELMVADSVRRWVDHVLPGDSAAADAATGLAVRCYIGGASVSEACSEARRFTGSWTRHPSHQNDTEFALRPAS